MTPQEYLRHTRQLDIRIDSKLERISHLRDMTTKVTSMLSDMPKSKNGSKSAFEDTIIKIVDLEREINQEIDSLVNLKASMQEAIQEIQDPDQRFVLELRYLNYKTWDEVAKSMGWTKRQVFRLHSEGLKNLNFY